MTAIEFLNRIKKIDTIISNKLEECRRWEGVASGLGGFSVSERVQTTRNLQKIPDAIGNYIDIEREIAVLKEERKAIIKTIEQLPTLEYDIIHKIFVQGFSMYEIAYDYKRSYNWVKYVKRSAVQHVQDILNGKSLS